MWRREWEKEWEEGRVGQPVEDENIRKFESQSCGEGRYLVASGHSAC